MATDNPKERRKKIFLLSFSTPSAQLIASVISIFKPASPIILVTILRKDLPSSTIRILRGLSTYFATLAYPSFNQNRQFNKKSVIKIKRLRDILSIRWTKSSHGLAIFLALKPDKSNIIVTLIICFYIVYTQNRV